MLLFAMFDGRMTAEFVAHRGQRSFGETHASFTIYARDRRANAIAQDSESAIAGSATSLIYFRLDSAKSQLMMFQKASTYFARALR